MAWLPWYAAYFRFLPIPETCGRWNFEGVSKLAAKPSIQFKSPLCVEAPLGENPATEPTDTIPIPRAKKKGKAQLEFNTEWTADRRQENDFINKIRVQRTKGSDHAPCDGVSATCGLLGLWVCRILNPRSRIAPPCRRFC